MISPSALSKLLAPMSVETFASEYWGKRSLLIRGGRDKLKALGLDGYTLDGVSDALERAGDRANVFAYASDDEGDTDHLPANGAVGRALRRAGYTLFINNTTVVFPDLADLSDEIRLALGYPGPFGAKIFFGGGDSTLGQHFDTFAVFSVQCDGRKRWLYEEEPRVASPRATIFTEEERRRYVRAHPWQVAAPPERSQYVEVVLEPGDVLYVPGGAWHATASEGGEALSMSFVVQHVGFQELVARALAHVDRVSLRENFPISDYLRTQGPRDELRQYVRARLDETAELLKAMTVEAFLADVFDNVPDVEHEAALDEPKPTPKPSDCLKLNPDRPALAARIAREGAEAVTVHVGGVEIDFSAATQPFFEELFRRRSFVASEATAWLGSSDRPFDHVAPLLGALLDQGVLVVESSTPP